MGTPPFQYQDPLPLSGDATEYRLLSREGVSTAPFEGREILKVDPEVLAFLAQQAFRGFIHARGAHQHGMQLRQRLLQMIRGRLLIFHRVQSYAI